MTFSKKKQRNLKQTLMRQPPNCLSQSPQKWASPSKTLSSDLREMVSIYAFYRVGVYSFMTSVLAQTYKLRLERQSKNNRHHFIENIQINKNKRIKQNFYDRLRLGVGVNAQLDVVSEEEEHNHDDEQKNHKQSKRSDGSNTALERTKSGSSNEGDRQSVFDVKAYLERYNKEIFKTMKSGQPDDIRRLMTYDVSDVPEEYKEKLVEKKKKHLLQAVESGWNTLHYAIFYKHQELMVFLLEQGADVNKITDDGWTPLQLVIYKNFTELFKILIKDRHLNVNLLTGKGLALHKACSAGKIQMVQSLLQAGADPKLVDKDNKNALDYCSTQEIYHLVENFKIVIPKQDEQPVKNDGLARFHPPRPPIVKGFIEKTGGLLFRPNKRYFQINPDDGTFIRFKRIEDYPFKPLEIIPLKNIRHVSMAKNEWYMKRNLFYFEIYYTSRMILACHHESAAKAWVELIYKAAVYSTHMEESLNNGMTIEQILKDQQLAQQTEITITDQSEYLAPDIERHLDACNLQFQMKPSSNEQQSQDQRAQSDLSQRTSSEISDDKNSINSQAKSQGNPASSHNLDQEEKEEIGKLIKDTKVTFESFEVIKILGSGAFGKVFLVRKKDDGAIHAMKALKKRNLIIKKQLKYAVTEANVLKSCLHPFILGLHYAFQTPNFLYLVLDYCPGGDLSYHLTQQTKFSESDTRFYIAELVLAIEYLHNQNVVYRDLKPENILLDKDGHIKLADFGLAKEGVGDADKAKSFCGSPAYLSPEMLMQKGAGKISDIYGIGAVMYEMLTGEPPFYSDDLPTMYKNIKEGTLKFPARISEEAKNCIKRMLERDPTKRLGAKSKQEIKDDPFFSGVNWNSVLKRELRPPITDFSDLQDDDMDDYDEIGYKGKPIFNDYDYDEENLKVNRVIKFSFSKETTNK